jgi:hypothetical protein
MQKTLPRDRRWNRGRTTLFDALAAALFVGLIVALIVVVCGALVLACPR